MPGLKLAAAVAALTLTLSMSSCGSDSSQGTSGGGDPAPASQPFRIPEGKPGVRPEATLKVEPGQLLGPEPKPVFPEGAPPETLALQDLIQGVGHFVEEGDEVVVQYVGYDYESGEKFVSSWDQGKPTTFTVGDGEMLEGVEEGILESEVGARREMVIPPALGYGSRQVGGVAPDSHLIFVVELLAAE